MGEVAMVHEVKGFQEVETADIYYAGYLMASGARLKEVKRNWSGKKQYSFVFAHDDMTPLAYGYISGQAVVNLKYLRSSIEHLKGIIFEKRHG